MSPELQLPGGDGKASLLCQLRELGQVPHIAAAALQYRVRYHGLQELLEGLALHELPLVWSLVPGAFFGALSCLKFQYLPR